MTTIIFIAIGLLILLSSCHTTKIQEPVVVERIKTDTLYQTKNIHHVDTCWQHDSVTITERGTDRVRTIYRVKLTERIDTIIKATHDTIPKIVTKTVTKEKRVFSTLDEVVMVVLMILLGISLIIMLEKR